MRRILASSLMLSSLLLPAAAKASTPVTDAVAPTQSARLSTGVIAPALVESAGVTIPENFFVSAFPAGDKVAVAFTVDEKGAPKDVHVVKSLNPYWDARVVDAVRRFRYRPGSLDNQVIPVDMNMVVTLSR